MSFIIDLNKSANDNIILASKQFGFKPMTIAEIIKTLRSYYSTNQNNSNYIMPQSGGVLGLGPTIGSYGFVVLRSGLEYAAVKVVTATAAVASGAATGAVQGAPGGPGGALTGAAIGAGVVIVGGIVSYMVIPRFWSGGGEKNSSEPLLLQTAKPLILELNNLLGPTFFESLVSFAEGLFIKKLLDQKNKQYTVSVSKEEIDLLRNKIFTLLIVSKIMNKYNKNYKNSNSNYTRKNNTIKNKNMKNINTFKNAIDNEIKAIFYQT